jgi:hypothetical protein
LNPRDQKLLDATLRNSERLMRLVGDSPDVRTIGSGAMTLKGTRAAGSGSGSSS